MIGIVVSEADSASVAIGEQLLARRAWDELEPGDDQTAAYRHGSFELRRFDQLHLSLDSVASAFSAATAIVFVSRHAGETGPLLTAHFPGNVGDAAYGGSSHDLPQSASALHRSVVDRLRELVPTGYDIGIECTHHGPSQVGAPCLFVEVGSGPEEWSDETAAAAVAEAVLDVDAATVEPPPHTVVGIGGGHYAPRFDRILRETSWHLGHIAADWALAEIDDRDTRREVIASLFEQSGTELCVFDNPEAVDRNLVESLGYRVVSETWLREADGVALAVIEAIEASLGSIETGTRVGRDTEVHPEELRSITVPSELVDELLAAEQEATVDLFETTTTAYQTTENGNRPTGDVLMSHVGTIEPIVRGAIPLLEDRYHSVHRDGTTLVLRKRAFDPDLASAAGIPEGPAFGRLANGESITIDDTVIEPRQVTRTEERRLDLAPL